MAWGCNEFTEYILGKQISIKNDHNPLVPVFGNKSLDNMPARILRFRRRLSQFEYDTKHVPGRCLYMADVISRVPLQTMTSSDSPTLKAEVEGFIDTAFQDLPATKKYSRLTTRLKQMIPHVPKLPAIAKKVGQKGARYHS